jgi:hypothetical protein
MKTKNIVLAGGSFSEHKGSAALLISTISNLTENFPDARFFFYLFYA